MDITDFLLARIAEDEETARAAGGEEWYTATVPAEWMRRHPDEPTHTIIDSPKSLVSYEVCTDGMAAHIARHDPARVLAECEAKRRIIAEVTGVDAEWWEDRYLYFIALPYAAHPDYRPEWKP